MKNIFKNTRRRFLPFAGLLVVLSVVTALTPLVTHAQQTPTFTQKVKIPTTAPTFASSVYPAFKGCKQWGGNQNPSADGLTVLFQCTLSPDTVRNCSYTNTSGGESGAVVDGTCEQVQSGKIIQQERITDNGLGVGYYKTDATGKTTAVTNGTGFDATKSVPTTEPKACVPGNLICYLGSGLAEILQGIAFVFMQITSWLLGIVGVMFNWLVVVTIFQFAVFFGNSEGMLLAWGILRDVGNILILFGFIYAGVMMVLDLHSFDARKAIPRLIIFAVLLNFSLFTGEAIVDVSNVLSAKLYQQAGQSIFKSCNGATALTECTNQVGIAEVIIQDTGLGSSYSFSKDGTSGGATQLGGDDHIRNLLAYIGVTILMGIVLILLLAASLMLLMRAITLVILLITSPIGFVGFAIPQLESQARKWWETLLSNAFFAPIFLLLLFIGLKVMDGLRGSIGEGDQTLINALSNPNVSIGSILIVFSLIVGFFLAALMFAKNSGAAGAQFATNFAQKTVTNAFTGSVGATGGLARFGYGMAARKVLGGKGRQFADNYNQKMDKWKHQPGWKGSLAKATDYVAGDSITGFGNGLAKHRFGNIRSLEESEAHQAHRDHETHIAGEKAQKGKAVTTALNMPNSTPEEKIARDEALAKALRAMPQALKEENDLFKKMNTNLADLSRVLSTKDFNGLMDSKKTPDDVKETLKTERFNKENGPQVIKQMKPKEVADLPDNVLREDHILAAMTSEKFEALDTRNLDKATKDKIAKYIMETSDDEAIEREKKKFRAKVGAVPSSIAVNPKLRSNWEEYFPAAAPTPALTPAPTPTPTPTPSTASSGKGSKSFT